MPFVSADRVQQTSATTGTGAYDLDASIPVGFQGFVAGIGNGNTCDYCVTDGTDWEVNSGGTVTDAATDTLSRNVVASSNGGAAVNWGAGTKTIFVTIPAKAVGPRRVWKTANETLATSTTVQNDDALLFAVAANTKYTFQVFLAYNTPAAADFKYTFTGPASPTLITFSDNQTAAASIAFGTERERLSGVTDFGLVIYGVLQNGANAGTVTLQWAQVSSSGTTTVYAGSYIEYWEVQ